MGARWVRPLPLRWRVFALLTALAGLLFVDAVLGARYNARLGTEQQLAGQLRPVEEVPERLIAGLVDQQNSVRGFALTGDERLLDIYEDMQSVEGRTILVLRRQLREEPELRALLDNVTVGATVWHQRVAEPVIRATRAGQDRRAARLIEVRDERLFEVLRRDTMVLSAAIDDQLAASQRRATDARSRLDVQLLISSVFGVMFLVASGVLIRRWLTRPVAALSAQVRTVSGGNLHQRIRGTGPIEYRRLGQDVEVMRRRILDELEETRRAGEALKQNAPLVLSLRSQLIGPEVSLPPGLQVTVRFEPADGVLAGDWVETLRLADDRVGLIVVDVSGHGPEAGLRALWLKHLLVPAMHLELAPAEALHWVAGQIGDTGEWFATIVILEVDPATGRCLYANAGHPPGLLVDADGVRHLPPTGPLFNVLPGARWDTVETTLHEDQLLAIYTDGLTEARSARGEEYGEERLERRLASAFGADAELLADRVMEEVHSFGSARLSDDATLALVTRHRVVRTARPTDASRGTGRPAGPPTAGSAPEGSTDADPSGVPRGPDRAQRSAGLSSTASSSSPDSM